MRGQIWTEAFAEQAVMWLVGQFPDEAPSLEVLLFSNEVVAKRQTTAADLVECTFPGYARLALDAALWQAQPPDLWGRGLCFYNGSPLAWTATGTSTDGIWGWGVLDTATGALWWFELLDNRAGMGSVDDFFQVVLRQRLTSEVPTLPDPG